ncbi:MAG: protein kinase family protein [Clostridia bacterium]|nr:protein kinase family protein [Clostridia bacterium]
MFKRDKIFSPDQKIDEYVITRLLGEGRYGICYLVSNGDKQFIFKQLKREMLKKTKAKAAYEWDILSRIQHERIPKFVKKVENDKFYGYVLEFIEGRTFEEIIFEKNYVFGKKEILSVLRQLIDIIKYLHSVGVVHRDIRVPNAIYHEGKVFLVDFGLARWMNHERYRQDVDFSYLGDFLIHLYYTSYETKGEKEKPWYEELNLTRHEMTFLKRLMGIEARYEKIKEVEDDFNLLQE